MDAQVIISFYDEMEKIAAGLSADQLRGVATKGAKRGWSVAREAKSINRLLSRDDRKSYYAAEAVKKLHPKVPDTVFSRRPRSEYVPPRAARKMGRKATGALGLGVGAAGAGEAEHLHHKKEEREAA